MQHRTVDLSNRDAMVAALIELHEELRKAAATVRQALDLGGIRTDDADKSGGAVLEGDRLVLPGFGLELKLATLVHDYVQNIDGKPHPDDGEDVIID